MSILKAILGLHTHPGGGRTPATTYYSGLQKQVLEQILSVDPDDTAANNRADLTLSLYHTFFEHPETAPSQLRRYNSAILHLCIFMSREGIPSPLVQEFLELGQALLEFEQGIVRPFLDVSKKVGSPRDPGDIWHCRAIVASALDLLIIDGMKKTKAASQLAQRYGVLGPVLTEGAFDRAMRKWHTDFKAGRVVDKYARDAFDMRFNLKDSYMAKGFEDRVVADKFMVDAMLLATRISDQAMAQLYAEVERRSKLNRPY